MAPMARHCSAPGLKTFSSRPARGALSQSFESPNWTDSGFHMLSQLSSSGICDSMSLRNWIEICNYHFVLFQPGLCIVLPVP